MVIFPSLGINVSFQLLWRQDTKFVLTASCEVALATKSENYLKDFYSSIYLLLAVL